MRVEIVQGGKLRGRISVLKFREGGSKLDISQRGIQDMAEVTGLNQLQDLKELSLSKNKIIEITGLENLANLKKLNLSGNQIKNVSGLKNLTELIQLDLSKNQINDIKGLENLTNLIQLNLSENQINDIKGLENLSNLRVLDISNNEILDSLTLRKLKESHLCLTNVDLRQNPCFNSIVGVEAEFLRQNPSKRSILTYLSDLRLYKEGIEYDPKEEWRYISDTVFCGIVGECFKLKPVFFMDSLYTDIRRMMKRQFGEEERRFMEKYILKKYCLYSGEHFLYECPGEIEQILDVKVSVKKGFIFVTNNRIIAQGTLDINAFYEPGFLGAPLTKYSKRTRGKKEFIEGSTDQELSCYGYQFPIKIHLDLKKTSNGIRYRIISPLNEPKQARIRLQYPNKENINNLFRALCKNTDQIIDLLRETYKRVNRKFKRGSLFYNCMRQLWKSEEYENLTDSDYLDIIREIYKFNPEYFMNAIYPKMMSWKFPSLITVKEAIMTLVDKLSNDSVS